MKSAESICQDHPRSKRNAVVPVWVILVMAFVPLCLGAVAFGVMRTGSQAMYSNAIKDPQKRTCKAYMHTISNCVMIAAIKNDSLDYSKFYGAIDIARLPDLSSVPICPNAGTYSIGAGTIEGNFKVTCSNPDHGSFEQGIDSQ